MMIAEAAYNKAEETRITELLRRFDLELPRDLHSTPLEKYACGIECIDDAESAAKAYRDNFYLFSRFKIDGIVTWPVNLVMLAELLLAAEKKGWAFTRSRDNNFIDLSGFAARIKEEHQTKVVRAPRPSNIPPSPKGHTYGVKAIYDLSRSEDLVPDKAVIAFNLRRPAGKVPSYDEIVLCRNDDKMFQFDTSIFYIPETADRARPRELEKLFE